PTGASHARHVRRPPGRTAFDPSGHRPTPVPLRLPTPTRLSLRRPLAGEAGGPRPLRPRRERGQPPAPPGLPLAGRAGGRLAGVVDQRPVHRGRSTTRPADPGPGGRSGRGRGGAGRGPAVRRADAVGGGRLSGVVLRVAGRGGTGVIPDG